MLVKNLQLSRTKFLSTSEINNLWSFKLGYITGDFSRHKRIALVVCNFLYRKSK